MGARKKEYQEGESILTRVLPGSQSILQGNKMKIRIVKPDKVENWHFPCFCKCSDPDSYPMYLESDTVEIDIDKMVQYWEKRGHLKIVDGEYVEIEFSQCLKEELKNEQTRMVARESSQVYLPKRSNCIQ